MCKLVGFIAFWIAIGIFLMLLLSHKLVGLLLMSCLLLLGYALFCK